MRHIVLPLHAAAAVLAASLFLDGSAHAAEGIYGMSGGARSMALGGADTASPEDPLAAFAGDPAGLSLLDKPELQAGFLSAVPYGHFTSKQGDNGTLSERVEAAPEGALAMPIPHTPLTLGIAALPEAGLSAHWHYIDPAGGLGGTTSYGFQRDNSEIDLYRYSAGLSIAITRQLSIGGSLNIDYNHNLLQTPYIFQSQHALRGFKTLLNLETDGWGANGTAGLLYRPIDTVEIGLSYQSSTVIKTRGQADAKASAQLNALGPGYAGVPRDLHYNAEVDNTFPQVVTGGISWKFLPHWDALAQLDWTNWSGAFNTLPVKLTHGSNRPVNTLVGSNALEDDIPLRWSDEFTIRAGLERELGENFVLRAGYSYGKSPVPDNTLTPMTAVLPVHSLTAGIGYRWRWLKVDLAYEWDLPVSRHVDQSALADGEYSNSTTRVGIQWVGLTTQVEF